MMSIIESQQIAVATELPAHEFEFVGHIKQLCSAVAPIISKNLVKHKSGFNSNWFNGKIAVFAANNGREIILNR